MEVDVFYELEKLLREVLAPGKRSPYISSDEIAQNDQRIKKALELVLIARVSYMDLAGGNLLAVIHSNVPSVGKDYMDSEEDD